MKITTWNVNGIRRREAEVVDWIARERPDLVCLQEVKASPKDVPSALCPLEGYWCFWHGHKGYSGVALLVGKALAPLEPVFFHPEFDHENRIVAARVGKLLVVSVYVPNGGKDYPAKLRFLEALEQFVGRELAAGSELVLCGDLNVALEDRDVHPVMRKPNQIGQRPEERALIAALLGHGLDDLLRRFHPDDDRLFTWWAPWRSFRQKNYGWRLDFVLASPGLSKRAQRCEVFREFGSSDHGPVLAELVEVLAAEPP